MMNPPGNPLGQPMRARMSKILLWPLVLALASCAVPERAPHATGTPEIQNPEIQNPKAQAPNGPPGPRVRSVTGTTPTAPDGNSFSFLAGGHLYGNPGALSAVPAATLLAQVHALRNSPDKFLVSSGDFIRAFMPAMVAPTGELLRFIEKPMFNAPGNHDYVAGDYEKAFGPSFGSFEYGSVLFVLLNSERQPWHFEQQQLDMVKATADWALQQPHIDHVFYFAHKVVFAVDEPRYASLLQNCNGRDGFNGTSNFAAEVLPTLRRVAKDKRVLWFCGDIGVSWSFNLFYDEHPEHNITYLGCGLGATESDCMLRVAVTGKTLKIEPVPMHVGATIKNGLRINKPVGHYGPAFWDQLFAKRGRAKLPKIPTGK